ncbi:hypothetical protein CX658_18910 [Pseudomonas amygdali pv. lachrymans]|nr:hypothetical protein CX658_18910 [Pseudomonas amygdali pv. lachrymans]
MPLDDRIGKCVLEFPQVLIQIVCVMPHHSPDVTMSMTNELATTAIWVFVESFAECVADTMQLIIV